MLFTQKRIILLAVGFVLSSIVGCDSQDQTDTPLVRVGSETIYQSEPDFIMSTLPPNRQNALKSPVHYREFIQGLVDTRVFSVAGKQSVPKARDQVEKELAKMELRDLSRYYHQKVLQEWLGADLSSLQVFYKKNSKMFMRDTILPPFKEIISEVARQYVLANSDLKSWFEKNKGRYIEKAKVEASIIATDTLSKIQAALKALQTKMPFDSVSAKYSDPRMAARKGKLGWIHKGDRRYELSHIAQADSLLFDQKGHLKDGENSGILSNGKGWAILGVKKYQPQTPLDYEKVKKNVENDFLAEYSRGLVKKRYDELIARYNVEYKKLPAPDAKLYYEKNKEKYKTRQAYHLHHLQNSDSSALAVVLPSLKTKADFTAHADLNQNTETKARAEDVGRVKATHALPWGIGMFPKLFKELKGKKPGFVSSILKAPDTKQYHVFFVDSVFDPQIKPFDRVQKSIEIRLAKGGEVEVDSATVLVTLGGKPLVREVDVINLKQEIPPQQRRRYTRDSLAHYVTTWELYTRDAQRMGINKQKEYRALRRLREANFWAAAYRDSVMNGGYGLSKSKLEEVWKANRKLFPGDFSHSLRDVALFQLIPDGVYQEELVTNPEKYAGTSLTDWKKSIAKLFPAVKFREERNVRMRFLAELTKKVGVEFLVDSLQDTSFVKLSSALSSARALYDARKLDEARAIYGKIKALFRGDSGVDAAYLGLAQILMEQKKYKEALNEYTIVARLYPKSENNYKAVFMRGFILSEHLKKDSLALDAFREELKRFPKSDLADDAQWMIKNIESGGKMAPRFLDSLSRVTDSLDALKKKSEKAKK